MSLETLTIFLGWSSIINVTVLIITALILTIWKKTILKIHNKLFRVNEEILTTTYFQYIRY